MNNRNGALSFDAYIGDTDFNRTIQSMNKKLEGLTGKTLEESRKMESAFSNLGRLAAGGLAAAGLSQLPAQIVKVRGEFQQLEISFNTMLGSKAKADKLLADVTKFAAQTPYGLKETASATKLLLAYGASADSAVETLRRLGDVAAGIGAPLGDIAYLYGTTMVQGRLYTQDLNQFLGRGIPLIGELAKILKVADGEVKGMVEAGKVGFPEVQKAFENLTKSGSMFGGLMEAQSKSLVGLQAQLGDAVDAMFNDIGRSQEGLLSETFKGAISVVENYKKVIDVLKVVVATYGAYRAAIMLTAAAQSASIILGEAQAFIALARSIKTAADAQALLNIAVRANPYVLAATALAGLVTAFIVFGDEASEAEKLQTRMNEAMKKAEDAAASEQAKIQVLTTQIKDETKSRDDRNKKLQELISLSPQHLNALNLENFATSEGTKLIGDYIEAKKRQIELKEIEAELEKSITNQNKAKRGENDLSFWDRLSLSAAASAGDLDYSKSSASERKRLNDQIVKDEDQVQAKLRERVKALSGVDAATTKSADNTGKAVRKTVADYNDAIKALRDKQEKSGTRAEFDAIEKQINSLESARDRITGGKQKSTAAKSAREEKEIRIKTFAEELDERKRLYELYDRWVLNYGKASADEQFSSLISKNKDYLAYVNAEIQRLETMRDVGYAGSLSNQDKFDLDSLISERTALTGGKSSIDQFKDKLDAVRDSSESLTDELIKVKAIQAELDPDDNSATGISKRQAAAEREVEIIKERKFLLQDFLLSVAGSEQRQTAIQKKYADMRAALDKANNDKKSAGYIKALDRIDKAEQEEIKEDKREASRKSKEFESMIKLTQKNYQELTEMDVEKAREDFKRLTKDLDNESDLYREHYKNLQVIESGFIQKRIDQVNLVAGAITEIGGIISNLPGGVGGAGESLAVAATQIASMTASIGKIAQTNKKNIDGSFNFAAVANWVTLVIEMINFAIKSNKKIKEEFDQWGRNYQEFISSVAKAANDKIGSAYKQNPFYTDYEGMIKAGVKQYSDALAKYNDTVSKLGQGRVIVGFDGGFWKKDKNIYRGLLETYPELVDAAGNLNREMAGHLLNASQLDEKTKILVQNAVDWYDQMEKAKEQIWDTVVQLTGQIGDTLADAMVTSFQDGTDSAQAWGDAVGNIIANIVRQTALIKFLQPALDQLQQEMGASYDPATGDFSIVDDLDRFKNYGFSGFQAGLDFMKQFDEWAKSSGYEDVFGTGSGKAEGSSSAMQGSIKGASEETVSILVGQFNAVRIYSAQTAFDVRQSLLILSQIAQNTSYTRMLIDVDDKLSRIIDQNNRSLRGFGF